MKPSVISLLLFSVCMFTGCIGEDDSPCPPENTGNMILNFTYKDKEGTDIFPATIRRVDVFIFDGGKRLAAHLTIRQSSLATFAGAELNLAPGTYHIVCWGNALDNTVFGGVAMGSAFADALLRNPTLNENNKAVNGNPLYYASLETEAFAVTSPFRGAKTQTITFSPAHIKIEVYIKGFENFPARSATLTPLVGVTSLPGSYNFNMQSFDPAISYNDAATERTIESRQLAVADFHTPVFGEDTPTQVLIGKQSDDSILTRVSLKDFIRENNIILDHSRQTVIPILVEYKLVGVNITLPRWAQKPIGPEFWQ